MNIVGDAMDGLVAACETIPDLQACRVENSASVRPPAVVVGPPTLRWEGGQCPGSAPTEAEFVVYIVVGATDRALEKLLDLVPLVAQAIEDDTAAVVTQAIPSGGTFGTVELPAYELTVVHPLT